MQSHSHSALCSPLPADLGVVYPGQTVSASLQVWRSDGEAVENFLVSPPGEGAPPGLTLYPRREDALHCCVDVIWQAPEKGVEPGPVLTSCELDVDGAALSVPVRMQLLAPRRRGLTHAPVRMQLLPKNSRSRKPIITERVRRSATLAAVALLSGFLGSAWTHLNGQQQSALIAAQYGTRGAEAAGGTISSLAPLLPPPIVDIAGPLPRILAVQQWRDITVWRILDGAGSQMRPAGLKAAEKIVVDTGRHDGKSGDALAALSTHEDELPAAVVFHNVGFAGEYGPLAVRRGSEERTEIARSAQEVSAVAGPVDDRRHDNLQRIAAFLQNESERARRTEDVARVDVLAHYRQVFWAESPFQGDFLDWHVRLANANTTQDKGDSITARELASLAARVDLAAHAVKTAVLVQPGTRMITRAVRVYRPLSDALILTAENVRATTDKVLRPVDREDNGAFYGLRLSRPIKYHGRQFRLLLSERPFVVASGRSMPRYIVHPDGVLRLAYGGLPATGADDPALLIPDTTVSVQVVEKARVQPASPRPVAQRE